MNISFANTWFPSQAVGNLVCLAFLRVEFLLMHEKLRAGCNGKPPTALLHPARVKSAVRRSAKGVARHVTNRSLCQYLARVLGGSESFKYGVL